MTKPPFHKAPLLLLSILLLVVNVAAAQDSTCRTAVCGQYGRLGLGLTPLEVPRDEFSSRPALTPSAALGISLRDNHALEIRIGYLHTQTTEDWSQIPEAQRGEAPYTISLRAIPVEAVYRYGIAALQVGGLEPIIGLGATWIGVKNSWESDTPPESSKTSVIGGIGFAGLEIHVIDGMSVVALAQYRRTIASGERFVQALKLGAISNHVGVQIFF